LPKVMGHKGTFIIPGLKKKSNLTTYFECAKDANFDKKVILEVLESLNIDEDEFISFSEGSYKIENIYGYGSLT